MNICTKVYVVTQGCYSDYHICGIYKTEEMAKAFCDEYNFFENGYDDYNYHEEEVLEIIPDRFDKEVKVIGFIYNEVLSLDAIQLEENYEELKEDIFIPWNEKGNYYFEFPMTARKDETREAFKERAQKVGIDKFYQWKAKCLL